MIIVPSDIVCRRQWVENIPIVSPANNSRCYRTRRIEFPDFFHQHGDLYHLAGSGHASRFEWAQEILANDPNPDEQVVEVMESALTVDFPVSAQRPLFSALDCSRFENEFGLCLPDWKQSLRLALS